MHDPAILLTRQFLDWVAARPRTYAEVKAGWRSTCPRLTPWEDAFDGGLVELAPIGPRVTDASPVTLTPRGRAMLAASPAAVSPTRIGVRKAAAE